MIKTKVRLSLEVDQSFTTAMSSPERDYIEDETSIAGWSEDDKIDRTKSTSPESSTSDWSKAGFDKTLNYPNHDDDFPHQSALVKIVTRRFKIVKQTSKIVNRGFKIVSAMPLSKVNYCKQ